MYLCMRRKHVTEHSATRRTSSACLSVSNLPRPLPPRPYSPLRRAPFSPSSARPEPAPLCPHWSCRDPYPASSPGWRAWPARISTDRSAQRGAMDFANSNSCSDSEQVPQHDHGPAWTRRMMEVGVIVGAICAAWPNDRDRTSPSPSPYPRRWDQGTVLIPRD